MPLEHNVFKLPALTVVPEKLFKVQNDTLTISVLLDEFELEGKKPYYRGIEPSHAISDGDISNVYMDIGNILLRKYELVGMDDWNHTQQRQVLEKSIRILDKAAATEKPPVGVFLALGKAYLFRSRLIRPKGFTVPDKKTEALQKGLSFCRKSKHKMAKHVEAATALEMDRLNIRPDHFEECLLRAATDYEFKNDENFAWIVEHFRTVLRLEKIQCRKHRKVNADIIKALEDVNNYAPCGLQPELFQIACFYSEIAGSPGKYRKDMLEKLERIPFSHRLWEDIVRFLVRLFKDANPEWIQLSQMLWKLAEDKTIHTPTLHLRWYWARQRNLYDLAFLSAIRQDNIKLAAQIADSAKSKPALTWQSLERMQNSDEIIKEQIQLNADALSGTFIKDLKAKKRGKIENLPTFPQKLHTSSIIILFYLVHLKDHEKGYTLIYDGNSANGWRYKPEYCFDFKPIWNAFVKWQSVYYRLSNQEKFLSASCLKHLCLELGKQLAFLFTLEKRRNLLFIPHDFLHRIPLHGIMLNESSILLESYRCTCLPALSYANEIPKPSNVEIVLLRYFDEKRDAGLINLFEDVEDLVENSRSINPAAPEDLWHLSNSPPHSIVFLCHGKADYINPFFSKLLLKKDMYLLDIAIKQDKFFGTVVFLSACESDLIPPTDSALDEHLSVASIFLDKQVKTVLSTMWEFDAKKSKFFQMLSILEKDEGCIEDVNYIQNVIWTDYKNTHETELLYHCLCVKVYSFE